MEHQQWNDFKAVSRAVVNVSKGEQYDTYCGRPGPWGNPFKVDTNMTRRQAVESHQRWLNELINEGDVTPQELIALTVSDDGSPRTMGCYCSPLMCHCHTLARYSSAAREGSEQLQLAMSESTANWYRHHAHLASRRQIGDDGYEVPFRGATEDDRPVQMPLELGIPPARNIPSKVGQTTVDTTTVRSILTSQHGRNSFVSGYDYTINPYQGCSAACDYCYAAGYTGDDNLSKTWGNWVKAKSNAAQALSRELHLLEHAQIYMATVTDPYQPVERQADITGSILDVMSRSTPHLVVQTRFPLVVRDIPRFEAIMANGGKVQVNVTVTTDDDDLRRIMEPKCPSIPARLKALADLSQAGITACATITPMLPVKNPETFAQRLQETGIQKVIIQQFHRSEGSGEQFRRSTRPAALQWLEENWGKNWRSSYQRHYQHVLSEVRKVFPDHTGEGQAGFAPPF